MLYRIKTEIYRVREFISRSRNNGLSLPYILFFHSPRLLVSMVYIKLAKRINDRLLSVTINKFLINSFHKKHSNEGGGHFYVIVMPNTLHFLIPCLELLPPEETVYLVFNGAKSWEQELLLKEFEDRPGLNLFTLPHSSINHGEVINLFLYANENNFGIIDHDLYIFKPEIFKELTFKSDQCMKAIFQGENRFSGMQYPHTFFLYFNTPQLKKVMVQYDVDARVYKKVSLDVESKLAEIGLLNGRFIKDYINYYDTLHVMLGLSYAESLEVDYLDTDAVYHLGGTSMGSQYAKDLSHMYISMCFLESLNHPLVMEKYLPYLAPFTSSEQIRQKLAPTPDVVHMKNTLHTILSLIQNQGLKKSENLL